MFRSIRSHSPHAAVSRRVEFGLLAAALVVGLLAPIATGGAALAVPPEFEDTVIASVDGPMDIAFTPEGQILVPSKGGQLWVIEDGVVMPTPAIDLSPIMCTNGERALGGVAVHPNFEVNHFVYLYYTYNKYGTCNESEVDGPVNRLSRFVLSHSNVIDPATEEVLFDTPALFRDHHNSGDIEFGKDGLLYVTVGDGGTRRFNWPADPGRLLGKIVRLTDDGGIPPGNPYTGADSARCNVDGVPPAGSPAGTKCQEVLSSGHRNPFRFAFDPNAADTRFYVNDVGQSAWEEISEGPIPGGDYGWPSREGPCAYDSTTDCLAAPSGLTDPIHWYPHGVDGGAATGGAFVPAGIWPAQYDGVYLFADYVFGTIYQLEPAGAECRTCSPPTSAFTQSVFSDTAQVVEMAFGPYQTSQALYYVDRFTDAVHRIAYVGSANRAPSAAATATPTAGSLPLDVQFDGTASSDPDGDVLSYAWDFDGDTVIDSTDSTPLHRYASDGTFFATLTVDDGNGEQASVALRIDAGNRPPIPTIGGPTDGTTFAVGDVMTLVGSATDPEEGVLADANLTWEVRQHHAAHYHPFIGETVGNNIALPPAPEPEDFAASTNSYLEVLLTATDSAGVSATVSRVIMPKVVELTFASEPAGLQLVLDDATITTPQTVISWENHSLRVEAPDQIDAASQPWAFASWSDGGAQDHSITVPASPASYSATFGPTVPSLLTFNPTDDATVRESRPDRNLGGDDEVKVDLSSRKDGLFKFDVVGVGSQSVSRATLRAYVTNSSGYPGAVHVTSDTSWTEDTVTWNLAPAPDGATFTTTDEPDRDTWIEWDVTAAVSGDGAFSVRLDSISSNSVGLASKEHVSGNRAELVVQLGSPPSPDTAPPSAPPSLMAVADTPTEIELSWLAASDNVGVTEYDIYRDGSLIESVSGAITDYEDLTVVPNRTYVYMVRARDAAGNISDPSTATATTPAPDTAPPGPPSDLASVVQGPTVVALGWSAAVDDIELAGYDIYRDGGVIGSVGASSTSFVDGGATAGATHEYFVRAFDTAGNTSVPSNTVVVTLPPAPSTLVVTPSGDATVREGRPDRNYGDDPVIEVDLSSRKDGLLRFDVAGVGGQSVTSVKFRTYVMDSSGYPGDVHMTTVTDWDEGSVTWNLAPAADGATFLTTDEAERGTWVEWDLTGAVVADGVLSLRLDSTSSNGVDYASVQDPAGNYPELVIEFG